LPAAISGGQTTSQSPELRRRQEQNACH